MKTNIRKLLTMLVILLFLVIIVIIVLFASKKNDATETPSESKAVPTTSSEQDSSNQQTLQQNTEIINKSQKEIESVKDKLPIYIKNYKTSVDITTNINIFKSNYDPAYSVRLEIYGINYYGATATDSNPNYIAFKESLSKAFSEMGAKGINTKELYYKFYSIDTINQIAESWARKAGLINY